MVAVRFNESACLDRLLAGAEEMGVEIRSRQQAQLMGFLSLLVKWNRAYNLTAVRDPLEMVGRHLLDSLVLLPYLKGRECLDIGTGAGLPGIPLGIMQPDVCFTLLDSNSKKIRFVRQVKLELGLSNIYPIHARVEAFCPDRRFPTLIARAFATLPKIVALSEALRMPNAEILAMKGVVPQQEIAQLLPEFSCEVIPLRIPFEKGERCLVRVWREETDSPDDIRC